jgi:hypothetical protein
MHYDPSEFVRRNSLRECTLPQCVESKLWTIAFRITQVTLKLLLFIESRWKQPSFLQNLGTFPSTATSTRMHTSRTTLFPSAKIIRRILLRIDRFLEVANAATRRAFASG